ncbi:DUF4865 family protein [Paludibacterium yongneupense]|uniref:DUF4865 family protein n=1 Tax=Paludibacterium yongneupense TaxID=400061 RepID=UPI000425C6F6|nr:DUF4865 family protein [Paludibacterium yongneupense]
MLAMQYSFSLPADYDMSVIQDRIAKNGHLMDGFPLLLFKTFLYARRDPTRRDARENLYAPFYLWERNEGMNAFLGGQGFAALTEAFGWPAIKTWSVWDAIVPSALGAASCATREILPIAPHASLAELQKRETDGLRFDIDTHGALAAVVGFDPGTWSLVRFRLWPAPRMRAAREGVQVYDIGHISTGVASRLPQ